MAAISAPANQRPKGPTLRARAWGQTGPPQEGKTGKREGALVLTLYAWPAWALQVISPT